MSGTKKPDFSKNDKAATVKYLEDQLKIAKERLELMIASNDEKGIAKMKDIINNLSHTLAK